MSVAEKVVRIGIIGTGRVGRSRMKAYAGIDGAKIHGKVIPPSGELHVAGGLDDEMMRPLDFAPWPDRPVRELFAADVVAADLRRLASLQQDDGGWPLEWRSYSPAAELEWRGYLTVRAVQLLRANRML